MKARYVAVILAVVVSNTTAVVLAQEANSTSVQATLAKLQERKTPTAVKVELMRELGRLGPAAEPALEVLLDPEFYMETVKKDPLLKAATIDTLARIGRPSAEAVVALIRYTPEKKPEPDAEDPATAKVSGRSDSKIASKARARQKKLREAMRLDVNELLRGMGEAGLTNEIVDVLEKDLLRQKKLKSPDLNRLALMGPESVPALRRIVQANPKSAGSIIGLIGPTPEITAAINKTIPAAYTAENWMHQNVAQRKNINFRMMFHANPDPDHIPALLGPLRDEAIMGGDYFRAAPMTALMLSGMGDAPALPLAELLSDPNPQTRREAARTLGMIGPSMKAALPALKKVYENDDERIDARIAAARAIAAIKSTDAAPLYAEIPNAHDRIVEHSREFQKRNQSKERWAQHLETNPDRTKARYLSLYNKNVEWQKPLYMLAIGEDVKEQNQWLREKAKEVLADPDLTEKGMVGAAAGTEAHHILVFLGSKSRHYPGRLEPDVERLLREVCFKAIDFDTESGHGYQIPKRVEDLKRYLAMDDRFIVLTMCNAHTRVDVTNYLCLQVLNEDPEFAKRTLVTGDTVGERFAYYTKYLYRGLKELALYGLTQARRGSFRNRSRSKRK